MEAKNISIFLISRSECPLFLIGSRSGSHNFDIRTSFISSASQRGGGEGGGCESIQPCGTSKGGEMEKSSADDVGGKRPEREKKVVWMGVATTTSTGDSLQWTTELCSGTYVHIFGGTPLTAETQ